MIAAGMQRQGDFAQRDPVTFLTGAEECGWGEGERRCTCVCVCYWGRTERGMEYRDGMVVMETVPRGFLNSKLDWLEQS